MAFNGFTKPFVSAYQGFGRHGGLATAGAAAAALIAPSLLKNDDRGYGQTAAITTPLITAGYLTAPEIIDRATGAASEFGHFWKNRPFAMSRRGVEWNGFPEMARKMEAYGPHIRQAMKDAFNRRAGKFYTSGGQKTFDSAEAISEIDSTLSRFEQEESRFFAAAAEARAAYKLDPKMVTGVTRQPFKAFNRNRPAGSLGSRRLILSHALEEAHRASLTPDTALAGANKEGIQIRSLAQIRSEFEANRGNEQFVRSLRRRMRIADSGRVSAAVPRNPNMPSSWAVAKLSPDAAIAELEMSKAGDAVRRAKAVQDAIARGWIGKDSKIVYALQGGERIEPIGAEIFHPFRNKSFSLPFTHPDRPTVSMGADWMHRGSAYRFWDEKGIYSPDDLILGNLSRGYEDAEAATQTAFSYSGLTDPNDPIDAVLHQDLQNAVKSEEAIALSSLNVNPNPFGGFGKDGAATFDKLGYESQVASIEVGMSKHGLTSMGPEGRLSEGRLQMPALKGAAVGQPASASIQDPGYRAWSKAVRLDNQSVKDFRRTMVDADFFRDTLRVGHAGNMPGVVLEEGMITPQMKALFGDIPEEAEVALNAAYNRRAERHRFKLWKNEWLEDYRKGGGKEWFEPEELMQQWKKSDDFRFFDEHRRKVANRWWGTDSGKTYASHAHEVLAKEMGVPADELVVKKAFLSYQKFLEEDPLRLSVRRLGRLGEYTALNSPDLKRAELELTQHFTVDSLHVNNPTAGMNLEPGILGFKDNQPIEVHKNSILERFEHSEDGWKVWVRRKLPFAGAKSDAGLGPKGGELVMENFMEPGDLWRRQLETVNFIGRETGTGVILPHTVQRISEARVSGFKTKLPVSQMLEDSLQIARDMVSGSYSAEAAARSERFLADLTANHLFHGTHRGVAETTAEVQKLSMEQQVLRSKAIAETASGYLNEIGASGVNHPAVDAFRRSSEVRAKAGREALPFTDWMSRTYQFRNVKPWAHDALNVQKEVGITYDMLNELARTGSHDAVAAIYGGIEWKHGDPARAAEVMEHLKRGQFDTNTLGNVLHKDAIPRVQGRAVDTRAGESVFNPFNPAVQDNYSVDLGAVMKDVEFAGAKTDVRYLPSLGMQSYKGGPNAYDGGWAWTELEKKKASVLEAMQDIDWNKIDPKSDQAKIARQRVSEYMNSLAEELSGKKGLLRADGVYRNSAAGYTAHYAPGPEASPFDIFVPKNVYGRQSEAVQAQLAGEGVFGTAFRHPVSAGYQVRYRYSNEAHLEPNQFGINPALSAPYQLDHDEDPFIALFYGQGEKDRKAAAAAKEAIANRESAQWKNLRVSNMFQAMEDSHNITYEMFEKSAKKATAFGEKSYLTELVDAVHSDQGLSGWRQKVLRGRLTFGSTGSYSNLSTKLQLMLSNNPQMNPADWDFQMMNRLSQYVRQVPISSSKGKMELGADPARLRNELNRALSRGKEGVGKAQELFTQIAGGAGFEGVYSEEMGNLTGITHKLSGEAFKPGETINLAEQFAASKMGREAIEKMVTGHDVRKVDLLSRMLVSKKVSAEDAMRTWSSGIDQLSPELTAMYRKGAGSESAFVRGAGKLFGERGAAAAEGVADALGSINEAIKGASKGGSFKKAGIAVAAGAGIAAAAGLFGTSVSSAKYRPEESVGLSDRVPGEPIAGSRSSVHPKRRLLPAPQGVKTMVAARVQQAVDLEVRAKAEDRGARHEIAKLTEQAAGGRGTTNVTVNRVGGWRDASSKLRLRSQIRDDLERF